jgi:hypothetical protein
MAGLTSPLSLTACFVHHPGSHLGSELRSRIYKHYRRDPHRNLGDGGLGLEVEYRSDSVPSLCQPIPIDFGRAQATAVVALFDKDVASDRDFNRYVGHIAASAKPLFPRATFLAVAVDKEGLRLAQSGPLGIWQTLDATEWTRGEFARRLFTAMDQHICRLLAAYLEARNTPGAPDLILRKAFARKIQVFLSHSKHDQDQRGKEIALHLKTALSNMAADAFFDAEDLPPGVPWEQALDDAASGHALIAILTDSYSSRTWCRKEVLAAKRSGMPILIANCLEDYEERSFPYAGNVPVIQMVPDPAARQPQLVGRLFDEILRDFVWRCHTIDAPPQGVIFRPRSPELISLASIERQLAQDGNPHPITVVYPGAPLGTEEIDLFNAVAPHVRLAPFVNWKAGLVS